MKTIARLVVNVFAFAIASYLVNGNDVPSHLGCAKVYAIHVLILLAITLVSYIAEDE